MKKNSLVISISINILFLLFGGYVIHSKGGIDYLKRILSLQKENTNQQDYGVYYDAKKSIFEIMPNDTSEIIFLGNSITDYCDWNELFGKSNIKNRGIGGDIINGVINRLDEVVESKPKKIFLMIGTNDLERGNNANEILSDYERLVKLILTKTPETELYLQSLLPTKDNPNRKNSDIIEINKGTFQIAKSHSLTYVNLFDLLKTDNNELNMEFSNDGVHINGKGYLIWKNEIIKYVDK
ncbi:GDSL-type esterase/lipase family protein [Algoriphagus sp. C2-6-M1]|uniref:GDSL-type esterase/lipase family protein n=1 Tax=Algoriphagus persicinus TaxID=3108754 RepID=UPI002B3F8340|nr:GDSL-type esterase/lipase family protein [Algoriphagus sp. C2-6-M1]MEB2781486.1 GDSL-type esterase/lipase family protein [Algoriphagus sp. C2-6-M1]